MNLKDSYIHGSNTQGALLKELNVSSEKVTLTYATPDASDPTKDKTKELDIPTWNLDTTGNAATATLGKNFLAVYATLVSRPNAYLAIYKVSLNGITELYDGLTIRVKFTGDTPGSLNSYLTIGESEENPILKPIYFRQATLATSTHLVANSDIVLTYRADPGTITLSATASRIPTTYTYNGTDKYTARLEYSYGGWVMNYSYDANTTYDLVQNTHSGAIKYATEPTRYSLVVGDYTGYKNLKDAGDGFDISYGILQFNSSTIPSAGATSTANYVTANVTISYTQALTMTAYKAVYILGKLDGTTFTPISTTPLTLVIPTEADTNGNDYYIYVGDAYSTTVVYLSPNHPIYWFKNGKFQLYNNAYVSSGKGYINGTEITTISGNAATATSVAWSGLTGDAPNISTFNNDAGYISSVSDLGLSNVLHFIGKATVDIEDGSNTDPIITGYIERKTGDVIIDKDNFYEYVWTIENKWEKLGSDGSYLLTSSVSGGGSDWGSSLTINGTTLTIPSKPTYSATDVGLDNVTNDAQVTDVSLYTGNSTDKDNTKSLSDGNVYIKLNKTISGSETEDSKILIKGGGSTSVTTDEDGNIVITGGSIPTNFYWANLSTTTVAQYDKEPEVKSLIIGNGSGTTASTSSCQLIYDATNKCLKFIFN